MPALLLASRPHLVSPLPAPGGRWLIATAVWALFSTKLAGGFFWNLGLVDHPSTIGPDQGRQGLTASGAELPRSGECVPAWRRPETG